MHPVYGVYGVYHAIVTISSNFITRRIDAMLSGLTTRSWRSSQARRAWLFTAARTLLPNSFTRFGL